MSVQTKQLTFTNDQDVINVLKDIAKGCSFATLEGTTKVNLLKKKHGTKKSDGMFTELVFKSTDIYSTASRHVSMGASYKVAMEKALSREAGEKVEYTPNELPYGEWISEGYTLLSSSGSLQLRYYPDMNKNRTEYVIHYADGTPLTDEELALLPLYQSPKQPSKPVECRNINISGLTRIKAFGIEMIRK